MRAPKRRLPKTEPTEHQGPTVADYFKEALGWEPSQRPFHTSAKRECRGCHVIKPGSAFDVPITPGRPDRNLCRECEAVRLPTGRL